MAAALPETESLNYFRVVSLLVDTGSVVLRQMFMKYAGALDQHLSNNKIKLENLQKRKILHQAQMDLLFPASGAADIEKFDITLLSCLMKNTCGTLHKQEWQEIDALKNSRNEVSGHMARAAIGENDFKKLWGKVGQIIINLAQFSNDPNFLKDVNDTIHDLWINPKLKPASHLSDLLQQWILSERRLEEDVKEIKSEIGRVETDIHKDLDKLDKRTAELEKKVNEDPGTNIPIDLERLRSWLLEAYKCYTSISALPLAEEGNIPLDVLFTDVAIIEDYQERDMENKDVGIPDEKTRKKVPVKSYKDIFESKEKEENVKSIVVLGEAGSGKTVYSKQMVNKWRKVHQKLLSGKKITGEEEIMARYDFLFYIPVRNIKRTDTLLDAVFQSVGDDKINRHTTQHVFEVCPEKILVICDGLDEIDWYPSRHNFHIFTIVTTTRPWKYDIIKGRSPRKDRVLKLKGLGENGVLEIAQRLRRTSYKNRPEASVDDFLKEVEQIGLMDSLNECPLILVYLLHVWFESGELSTSLTTNLLGIIECILARGDKKLKSREDNLLKHDFSHRLELTGVLLGPKCQKYGKLLMVAAKIAFKGLTNTTPESSLVFSDAMLNKIIESKEHLEASLQLGLISESEKVHISHTDHNFSFPHKLFQELFMALHLVNNQASLTEFKNYCDTLDKVLEMSNVFIFTSGLCNKTALQLSKHVVDICDRDKRLVDFRLGKSAKTGDLIGDMTEMYIKCTDEHMKLNPDSKCELCMSDMYIVCKHRDIQNWGRLTTLLQTNACSLQSLYINTVRADILARTDTIRENILDNINNTLQQMTKAKRLIHLHLTIATCDKDTNTYINKIIANNSNLCVLHIGQDRFSESRLSLRFPGWWRPPLRHLQHLYLRQVTTTRFFSSRLSALLRLGHLRSLHLRRVDIGDIYLDMSHLTHMDQLTLQLEALSGSQWWRLLKSLNKLSALKELQVLGDRRPQLYRGVSTPPVDFHLSFINRLHNLELWDDGSSPVLHHILCGIGDDSKVKRLKVEWRSIPATSVHPLLSAVTHSHHLKELELGYINARRHHFSLHNNTKLETLKLYEVTMSPKAWDQLFASIQMSSHLNVLCIDMKVLSDHPAPDPGATSWSRLFTSLQSLPHMAVLRLGNVNIPGDVRLPNNITVTDMKLHDNGNIKMLFGMQRYTE